VYGKYHGGHGGVPGIPWGHLRSQCTYPPQKALGYSDARRKKNRGPGRTLSNHGFAISLEIKHNLYFTVAPWGSELVYYSHSKAVEGRPGLLLIFKRASYRNHLDISVLVYRISKLFCRSRSRLSSLQRTCWLACTQHCSVGWVVHVHAPRRPISLLPSRSTVFRLLDCPLSNSMTHRIRRSRRGCDLGRLSAQTASLSW
jgi:hypothetical protein